MIELRYVPSLYYLVCVVIVSRVELRVGPLCVVRFDTGSTTNDSKVTCLPHTQCLVEWWLRYVYSCMANRTHARTARLHMTRGQLLRI